MSIIVYSYQNNVYVGGWFSAQPINILGNIYTLPPNAQSPQQFLIKYDPSGNVLWYKIINGILGSGAVAADKNGNIYLTNSYTTLTIDNISLNAEYNNAENIFIMKADSAGNILWYKKSIADVNGAGASTGGICVSPNEDVLITGSMSKTNTFGSYTLTQSSVYSDLLIVKISQPFGTGVSPINSSNGMENCEFYVFPNPAGNIVTIKISSSAKGKLILTIKNELGQTVYSENKKDFSSEYVNTIDLSRQPKGIYFVEMILGSDRRTRKIIIE